MVGQIGHRSVDWRIASCASVRPATTSRRTRSYRGQLLYAGRTVALPRVSWSVYGSGETATGHRRHPRSGRLRPTRNSDECVTAEPGCPPSRYRPVHHGAHRAGERGEVGDGGPDGGPLYPPICQCQRYKLRRREAFGSFPAEERACRLREQTNCGKPQAAMTSGLVAYLDDEPVGWCAVEERSAYEGLVRNNRVPWTDRNEDKTDDSVPAVDFARERGASAIEGSPMITQSGEEIT